MDSIENRKEKKKLQKIDLLAYIFCKRVQYLQRSHYVRARQRSENQSLR